MRAETLGLVLAGGLGRRMGGGDKPLRPLSGRPMLAHVLERLRPQCAALLISANGDPARLAPWTRPPSSLPVVADSLPDHPGPLAGILAGMEWAATHRPDLPWLASAPGDSPFLPPDLVARLHAARAAAGVPAACAASGGAMHPPVGLWPVSLRGALREALLEGERQVRRWAGRQGCAVAEWGVEGGDPFFNVNTPEELEEAERMMR